MFEFWRRRKLLRHALPAQDWVRACARLDLLRGLSSEELQLLREIVTLFLAGKIVAPSAQFSLDACQRIEIAIWACIPVLRLGLRSYDSFHGVIVYPDEFLAPREDIDEAGVVHIGHEQVAGESWDAGPILLSWADVEQSRELDGYNVVIHECAHKLDLLDGDVNGVPDLSGSGISGALWMEVMRAAWEHTGAQEQQWGESDIDDYALESPAEFFAVLSEHFFTAPEHLSEALPDAYDLLQRFYRLDPLAWHRRMHAATG
jgi:MtfA peptidase